MDLQLNTVSNVTTNVANNTAATVQNAQNTTIEDFGMAQIQSDEFTSSIATTDRGISELDDAIANTTDAATKEELLAKKADLKNQKETLEAKQADLKRKMDSMKNEISSYKSALNATKNEIYKLSSDKASLEETMSDENEKLQEKQESLENVNNKIATTKADLTNAFSEMTATVRQMEKDSENELLKQRKTISAATNEGMARVQAGEIDSADLPAFIASKISNCNSVGATSNTSVAERMNSKVKSLCGLLSSYSSQSSILQQTISASKEKIASVSPLMDSISSQIKERSTALKSNEATLNSKEATYSGYATEYANNSTQLASVNADLQTVDAQISILDNNTAQNAQVTALNVDNDSATSAITFSQLFAPATSSSSINIDDALSKINKTYEDSIKNANTQTSQTDELTLKMSEGDEMVMTLRSHLVDNAQKLIDERLSATKRN